MIKTSVGMLSLDCWLSMFDGFQMWPKAIKWFYDSEFEYWDWFDLLGISLDSFKLL